MNINVNENSDGERKEEELDEGQQPAKVEPEDGNSQKNEKEEKPKEDKNINNKKDDEVVGDGDDEDRGTVDDGSPSPSMADPNDIKDEEECKEGETCPQIMKNINEQYLDYRETAKTMIYMIDCRERAKIYKWICKLDSMDDEEGQLERLLYIKYLVQTLSEPFGLVDPFTSYPPDRLKPLRNVLAPVVFADLLEEQPDKCFKKRTPEPNKKEDPAFGPVQDDKKFFSQQLYPPEGIVCYAVAFSTL